MCWVWGWIKGEKESHHKGQEKHSISLQGFGMNLWQSSAAAFWQAEVAMLLVKKGCGLKGKLYHQFKMTVLCAAWKVQQFLGKS